MKIKFSLLLLAMLPVSVHVFGQSSLRPASIVKMTGDTISGFVRYEGWTKSPTSVQFKNNLNETRFETLTPKQILGFSVNGVEAFVSYTGPVSTNKIEGPEIPYFRDTTVKSVSVFLSVVTKGANVELLAHRDEVKTAYFIKDKNEVPVELKFYRYYNDNDRVVSSAPFRQVLISLLEKCRGVNEKWFKDVGVADYNLGTLKRLVNNINNNESKETSISGHRFFVGAAAAYQHFTFVGPERYRYQPVDDDLAPVFNVGYDFYTNKFSTKTIFRIEVGATQISPMFEGPYSIFILKAIVVSVKPQVLYTFKAGNKVKPFFAAGVGINVPFESDNRVIANPKAIPSPGTQTILINGDTRGALQVGQSVKSPFLNLTTFVTPEVKVGMSFNNKFEVIASAALLGTNMLKSLIPTQMTFYSLGLNYYLGGKK
jgi:hypothetical protein